MKTTTLLVALSLLCFFLAACETVTPEAIAAVGASAGALVAAIQPLLSPEEFARLEMIARNVDGTVDATAKAVSTIVDVIGSMKANAAAAATAAQAHTQAVSQQIAALPDHQDVALQATGISAATGAGLNVWRNATRSKVLKTVAKG